MKTCGNRSPVGFGSQGYRHPRDRRIRILVVRDSPTGPAFQDSVDD